MATRIPQPPRSKGGVYDPQEIARWFDSIWLFVKAVAGLAWGSINFTGSSLSDIAFRPHSALQGLDVVGVHPHAALTGRDVIDSHPHESLSDKNSFSQHHVRALTFPVIPTTTTYTITDQDFAVEADPTGGDFPVILPSAVGLDGHIFAISNTGTAGIVNVTPDGTEKINGVAGIFALYIGEAILLQSNGANWRFR